MFAPAFCLVWVVKRQWDVGRPAPRPPRRFTAMRSHAVCRCRGRRPRRPAEVSGGGRYAGGMNFSPTGYLLAGVGRKVAEGSRPLPTMQRIKEWQWQGSVNGLRTRGAREGGSPSPSKLAGGCPGTGGDVRPVGIPQSANAASPL